MSSYNWQINVPAREGSYIRVVAADDPLVQLMEKTVGPENILAFRHLAVCWTALICDSPLTELPPRSVYQRFLNKFLRAPLEVITQYSDLAGELEEILAVGVSAFSIESLLISFAKTPVFRVAKRFLLEDRDPAYLRYLLSFCNFGKKVEYVDDQLHATALRGWEEVESRLGNLILPPWLKNLRAVMDVITEGWLDCDFLPKHGPGAVAEGCNKTVKAKNERFSVSPSVKYMYFTPKLSEDHHVHSAFSPHPRLKPLTEHEVSRDMAAHLIFVPKTITKSRSIAKEPIGQQWAQQGVRKWFEHEMSMSVLGPHVTLKDQGSNRNLARRGSIEHCVDTIDLSSASDSVAWQLITHCFKPGILKHLAATRTPLTLMPDGSLRRVHKYAPMGSAMCFPVQSMLYSAVTALVSIAQTHGLVWDSPGCFDGLDIRALWNSTFHDNPKTDRYGNRKVIPFSIYGDDIVCDSTTTSNIIDCLRRLGFEVNTSKSFMGLSDYRESCGGHYYSGHDVTPLRYKCKRLTSRLSIESLAGIIDFANRAFDYGYTHLRRHLVSFTLYYQVTGVRVRPGEKNPVLFTHEADLDSSFALRCKEPRNTHLRRRALSLDSQSSESNARYQRSEWRSIHAVPVQTEAPSFDKDGNYYYHLYWRQSQYVESAEVEKPTLVVVRGTQTSDDKLLLLSGSYVDDDSKSSTVYAAEPSRLGPKWRWTPT